MAARIVPPTSMILSVVHMIWCLSSGIMMARHIPNTSRMMPIVLQMMRSMAYIFRLVFPLKG